MKRQQPSKLLVGEALAGLRFKLQHWMDIYPVQDSESVISLVKNELLAPHQPRKWQHPSGIVLIQREALCLCGEVMRYEHGDFVCRCGHISREVFYKGLHDYRLLVSEWITSRELRDFFFITSKDIANKLLIRANFYYEGNAKSRRYLIPEGVWRKSIDEEEWSMTNILDFLQYKNEKEEARLLKLFQKAHSLDERLDALIKTKYLQVEDHKLFLAFLTYLEQEKIEPQQLFKDVINLPKFEFEANYEMNWGQAVRLAVTFLTILRSNDPDSYQQFTR